MDVIEERTRKPIDTPKEPVLEMPTDTQPTVHTQPTKPEEKKTTEYSNDVSIGSIVKSKRLGNGTVEQIEEKGNKKYLTIDFGGEKKKFVLPDAFDAGFLTL